MNDKRTLEGILVSINSRIGNLRGLIRVPPKYLLVIIYLLLFFFFYFFVLLQKIVTTYEWRLSLLHILVSFTTELSILHTLSEAATQAFPEKKDVLKIWAKPWKNKYQGVRLDIQNKNETIETKKEIKWSNKMRLTTTWKISHKPKT